MKYSRENIVIVYEKGGVACRICDAAYAGKSESELELVRDEARRAARHIIADRVRELNRSDEENKKAEP